MSDQQEQPVFSIEKLYVKDLSLEVPNAPQVYLEAQQPEVDMQLHTQTQQLDDGYFESVLTITVTARLGEKTVFLVEATQGGIFQIRHIPAEDLEPILGMACPNILFPYVREVISDIVSRAGFPPVILAPINFEQLYMQRQNQAASQDAPATVQ
ncbi:protein-export chaperone SecB [Chitinimonas sp. BJB300]|uniref:protein-export chaperone SecB n=1 Tax=Chitinimonas sp. BJB300 TaxID=1559339 RepID=UPI000C106A94|nr:protein-export chaperone SecB [Chitinimonas sp. BJB300]PHV10320.1 protein-export chaperone SecB [Chitinimonas sp. BJB300]TSJ91628.1 protein-export chaperone SecB [Chitinimonas sp. BJB300]